MSKRIIQLVQSIPGWLTVPEGRFLDKMVKETDKLDGAIVEIGSFCGKSTIWLAQHAKKVYAIDPHKGHVEDTLQFEPTYKKFIQSLSKAQVVQKVQPLVKTSQEAAKKWKKQIRVIFIDGLHDTENAYLDFRLWTPFVVEGGIVAIHDSFKKWCGSEKIAVKHIVLSSDFYKIGFVDSIIYGVKGKGSVLDRMKKLYWQLYIIFSIEIYHMRCVFGMVRKELVDNTKYPFHFNKS